MWTPKNVVRLMLLSAFITMLSGCGPGRKAQCRELGSATREVMQQVEATYQSQIGGNAYDPDFERNLANAWESGVGMVETLDLADRELKSIRDELAIAYQQAATAHRQAADLIPPNGRLNSDVEAQVDAIQLQAEAGIPPAINQLNLYCIGG